MHYCLGIALATPNARRPSGRGMRHECVDPVVIAGLDPAIHLLRDKLVAKWMDHPKSGFTRFRATQVRKSDKSDLRGQARG
jgi:hypothetical protein